MRLMTLFILALSIAAAQTTVTLDSQGTVSMQPWLEKTQTAERTVEIPGHYYVVRYQYNTQYSTIPAVPGAKAHYSASIEVFEVIDGSKQQIGKSFAGQYVEGGCFEDKPEKLVMEALEFVDRLTPEIEAAFDERDRKAAFEAQPLYNQLGPVLTITSKGARDLEKIVVDGKTVWERKP